MEPAVFDGLGGRFFIAVISFHHVFAPDGDFTFLVVGQFVACIIAYFQFHRLHQVPGRPQLVAFLSVGRNDGRSFRKPVALEHGHAHGIEKPLQIDIEERTAPDEVLQLPAETFTDFGEKDFVEKHHQRFFQRLQSLAFVMSFLVVFISHVHGKIEKARNHRSFGVNAGDDIFPEIFGQSRHA